MCCYFSMIVQNIFTIYLTCILHNNTKVINYATTGSNDLNDICDIFTVQNTIDNMMLGDPWDVELMENRTIRVRIYHADQTKDYEISICASPLSTRLKGLITKYDFMDSG